MTRNALIKHGVQIVWKFCRQAVRLAVWHNLISIFLKKMCFYKNKSNKKIQYKFAAVVKSDEFVFV